MRSTHLRLFLTTFYVLVNYKAKWKNLSDQVIFNMSLKQCKQVPQLFRYKMEGRLVLIVAKLVNDLKAAGGGDNTFTFTKKFNESFELAMTWKGSIETSFLV